MISRGDICWVDFGPIVDRSPAKRRPVVVVQANQYTQSSLGTIIVATMTSATRRAMVAGNVFVPASASGLARDSVVIATEVQTLDRECMSEPIGLVPATLMRDVDAGLRRVLQL